MSPEAFGKPGIPPRWTSSAKEGIGTAYHTSSRVWFTLSHGILNEVYYPTVDTPNLRDLQFLITDGETFLHEERSDLESEIDYCEPGTLFYKFTNTDTEGRYRIEKEYLCAPHQSVVLILGRVTVLDDALKDKIKIYLLAAPHVAGKGEENSARVHAQGGETFLHASRCGCHMMLAARPPLGRRSVGFVGASDGFTDLAENKKMDWEFREACDGNVAMVAEMVLDEDGGFVIGVGMGATPVSASAAVSQALAIPYAEHRERYVAQWKRASFEGGRMALVPADFTGDGGSLFRASRCILLAHEDKIYQGATVASISIPWGETKSDSDAGGYHLVWPRDLYHTMCALIAAGHPASALRSLIWMANVQEVDGSMPQNCWIDGEVYWGGCQLDETAAPVLVAWHLRRCGGLKGYDPWPFIARALRFLLLQGPVTGQERWEEASGYSPATLAAVISAMVCGADFADDRGDDTSAELLRSYADWISDRLEGWTATTAGTLDPEIPHHYIRIAPAGADDPHAEPDPDGADLVLANGGGTHPAREIVGGDFLELVRLGIRRADDPLVRDSVRLYDAQLKVETPNGPCWRRYNFDGYGQKQDGSAFDGTGYGGAWPLLTGERGHYAIAAGEDPMPYVRAMENFSNCGQMIPEQVWPLPDLEDGCFKLGAPAGSAMPLCWSHAEYIALTKSAEAGHPVDRPDSVAKRYAESDTVGKSEVWLFRRRIARIRKGKSLTVILDAPATVRHTADGWKTSDELPTEETALGVHFVTLKGSAALKEGDALEFTFRWEDGRWENENFTVGIEG